MPQPKLLSLSRLHIRQPSHAVHRENCKKVWTTTRTTRQEPDKGPDTENVQDILVWKFSPFFDGAVYICEHEGGDDCGGQKAQFLASSPRGW